MKGTVAGQRGDVASCSRELRQAMELADAVGGDLAQPVFHRPGIPIRAFLGAVLTIHGEEDGPALAAAADKMAEQSADPFDECLCETFQGLSAATLADPRGALRHGRRARALGDAHGYSFYALLGAQIEGWAAAVAPDHGPPTDARRLAGVTLLRNSQAAYAATGAHTIATLFWSLLSEAELATGRPEPAAAAARLGLALSEENGERLWRDHLHHAQEAAAAADPAATVTLSSV